MSHSSQVMVGRTISEASEMASDFHWKMAELLSLIKRYEPALYLHAASLCGIASGRTDEMIEVYRRFMDLRSDLTQITFEHFVHALIYGDDHARDCLRWANDMMATVAEMKAWSRVQLNQPIDA